MVGQAWGLTKYLSIMEMCHNLVVVHDEVAVHDLSHLFARIKLDGGYLWIAGHHSFHCSFFGLKQKNKIYFNKWTCSLSENLLDNSELYLRFELMFALHSVRWLQKIYSFQAFVFLKILSRFFRIDFFSIFRLNWFSINVAKTQLIECN